MYQRLLMGSAALACAALLAACGGGSEAADEGERVSINPDPYPSTYVPRPSATTLITNATILDGVGNRIDNGSVLIVEGRISAIGTELETPEGAVVIDAAGKWLTPGIIDNHSHLGVYASPGVLAHSDGNEITGPVTAEVWAEHAVWPQDPGFTRAIAGGITAMQVLPGSANLFGGRGVILKNVPARTAQDMKFPNAPYTVKMACGENPKRLYGGRGQAPGSRMGNFAGYRQAWAKAVEYKRSWEKYEAEGGTPPARDLELDTLAGVLSGDILVHMHCYRADEMVQVLDMADEFGYKVSSFHHGVEAYKIADYLAETGTCASIWADWWGFKMEAYDGIPENLPLVHNAGACAIVHSDSPVGIQRLNQEAAKAWSDGLRAGLEITQAEAWSWLSANPARSLGIFGETGSIEPGKAADLVIWTADPFSVYARAEQVFIDGAKLYDLNNDSLLPVTDFELGQPGEGDRK